MDQWSCPLIFSRHVILLAELLNIPGGDLYAPRQLNPQRKKEETFEALLRQLVALAQHQPVLMIYEDVHWIDPSSRELLDRTIDRVAGLPMLLLITFLSRNLASLGHDARLMPAKYVRPYSKGQKNDFNDAEARRWCAQDRDGCAAGLAAAH